jgi:uncharacterized protein
MRRAVRVRCIRMTVVPMFPLGSVLFPAMPMGLRVFEDRYLVMLARVLQQPRPEFGVVLIERGAEVGGGEQRFAVGTMARIERSDGGVGLVAAGGTRIEVVRWHDDDPHPVAEVRELPDLEWHASLAPKLERADALVRATVARVSEFGEVRWPSDVELADEPMERAWQLAGVAPIGALDQLALLRSGSADELLDGVIEHTTLVAQTLSAAPPIVDDGFGDELREG